MLLGADSYGRDVFSRLLFGARVSLGLALVAALSALLVGSAVGGLAGYAGGPADDVLMRAADFVLVLPAIYVALALRAVLPLVLAPRTVFAASRRHLRHRRRAVLRPRGSCDRPDGTHAGLCGCCHCAWRQSLAGVGEASAAGRARIHDRADHHARAGVHHRRGDAVVRRARLSGSDGDLGHDAARCVERSRLRRFSVAAQSGGGDVPGGLRAQPGTRAIERAGRTGCAASRCGKPAPTRSALR